MTTPLWIGPGTFSLWRKPLALRIILRISTPWGQAYSQRPHRVQDPANRESMSSWSNPRRPCGPPSWGPSHPPRLHGAAARTGPAGKAHVCPLGGNAKLTLLAIDHDRFHSSLSVIYGSKDLPNACPGPDPGPPGSNDIGTYAMAASITSRN